MKKIYIIVFVYILLVTNFAYAEDESLSIIDKQINSLNIHEIEEILDDTINESETLLKIDTKNLLLNLIKGEISFSFSDILKSISKNEYYAVLSTYLMKMKKQYEILD